MTDRRKPASKITPEYEDSGIFSNPLTQLVVDLVPTLGRNSRQDVMIKGFVDGTTPIDVVFAGRRKFQVEPLIRKLHVLWSRANRNIGKNDRPPEPDEVRLRARIEGAWRPRFERDDQGWQTRTFQLFAARLLVNDDNGEAVAYGEPPARSGYAAKAGTRPPK